MAAVLDLAQASMPFPFLVDEEPLQPSDYGPLAYAGGGSDELSAVAIDVSDYMMLHGGSPEGLPAQHWKPELPAEGSADSCMVDETSNGMGKRARMDPGVRIAFRTRSENVDVLDDGYKWRKYGKKSVKNSPNPRNYYRCSAEGCGVKKRVERDREDPSFVMTTYDGAHNHLPPGVVYYPVPRDPAAAAAAAAMAAWGSSSWIYGHDDGGFCSEQP